MSDEPTGPWALALSALVIGGVALAVELRRQFRRRTGDDESATDDGGTTR